MQWPTIPPESLAWISRADMIEVDRVMIEDLGIGLLQMMENAGRNLARLVIERFDPASAAVLAGSGGNGGGGLCAARHLANAGIDVSVTTTRAPEDYSGAAAVQLRILEQMGVRFTPAPAKADVILDALIGYSLNGAPTGRTADLISQAGELGIDVVALDNPSGLDVTSGIAPGACIEATATLTLAAPKSGLATAAQVGELYLADISVPPSVIEHFDAGPAPDFRPSPILRVEGP